VTGSSDDLVRRAVALGADPSSAMAIPYGVDVDFFSPDRPIDRAAVRKKLGAPDDAFLIVAVGRLIEVKGFEYLIEAARLTPGVHVAIAGDGDLRDQLEERIRSTAAPVRLVGPLDRDAVATVFVAADAIAVPSIVDSHGNVDGLPNTLLEALASGRPVVATRVGGIPEVINDGTNGVLVPEKDAGALAAALRRFAEDSSPRAQLGLAGRATVAERFSWQETARAFEEAYDLAAA
jgi:glycosyltransferase involved in cell wall biosynthesis